MTAPQPAKQVLAPDARCLDRSGSVLPCYVREAKRFQAEAQAGQAAVNSTLMHRQSSSKWGINGIIWLLHQGWAVLPGTVQIFIPNGCPESCSKRLTLWTEREPVYLEVSS